MAHLVDQTLEAKKQFADDRGRTKASPPQIDTLVYELYNLTPEEIAIVEGQSK